MTSQMKGNSAMHVRVVAASALVALWANRLAMLGTLGLLLILTSLVLTVFLKRKARPWVIAAGLLGIVLVEATLLIVFTVTDRIQLDAISYVIHHRYSLGARSLALVGQIAAP